MSDLETNRDGRIVETRSSSSAGWIIAILVIVALVVAAFAFGFINIDQTRETSLPTVKMEATSGQAPAFDVNTAKVDVGTTKTTVEVPTVDVGTKDTAVTLPTISVEPADKPKQ